MEAKLNTKWNGTLVGCPQKLCCAKKDQRCRLILAIECSVKRTTSFKYKHIQYKLTCDKYRTSQNARLVNDGNV